MDYTYTLNIIKNEVVADNTEGDITLQEISQGQVSLMQQPSPFQTLPMLIIQLELSCCF